MLQLLQKLVQLLKVREQCEVNMAGFKRNKELVENAYRDGQFTFTSFTKVPAITTVQGIWFDVSMSPGNPKPNYYATAELTSETLEGFNGLYKSGNVAPAKRYLHKMCIGSVNAGIAPATFMLLDYLLYYPLIDMDSTDEQALNNSKSLPRYTDGDGVQAMIIATNPYVGGATFQINYTNSNGVSGRTSIVTTSNTATNIGTLITSGTAATNLGAFIPLCPDDKGIRSVESVTFNSPNGGLAVLVLVKPLATIVSQETTAFSEVDFALDKPSLPEIKDGAYLNFICMPNGNAAGQRILGDMFTIWN